MQRNVTTARYPFSRSCAACQVPQAIQHPGHQVPRSLPVGTRSTGQLCWSIRRVSATRKMNQRVHDPMMRGVSGTRTRHSLVACPSLPHMERCPAVKGCCLQLPAPKGVCDL
jgi:hypothetical protein